MTTSDRETYEFVSTAMSTTVSVQIVGAHPNADALAAEAMDWFRVVEATCSRFDHKSELARLCAAAPAPTTVSPLLFEALRVAMAVAVESDGAFDPTLGESLRARGFDRRWQSGERLSPSDGGVVSRADWRDVVLDDDTMQVTLPAGTMLDLGAVAKGFAIDLAARGLSAVADCCVVAGGDLLCRGVNARQRPWRTAIVDPQAPARALGVLEVRAPEYAVCTSGGYVRRTSDGHHLLDATQPHAPSAVRLASSTVIAPQAAVADALATAAFVLGAGRARVLLEAQQVDAVLVEHDGTVHLVQGWGRTAYEPHSH